ncbi:FadR/GntR family transcriptional regulator [Corynebacterium sp. CNJ-954]|uniref:FadR/GntR family transcriptional regulator n=1 Tax=Corynebacterium sp. CNJ-954 TaxID=1904962 RepID=UPI00096A2776|nr:FCD domain-containing protein [Corynebacterium sp. CNJ-954]
MTRSTESTSSPNAGKDVIEYFNSLISSGTLGPGNKLPPERTVAEDLGCTRNEVRKAMAHLESKGIVTRHVGRGTYLAADPQKPSPSKKASPAELMSARILLEPEIVGLVTVTANEEDFQEMLRCLEEGEKSDTYDEFEQWDIRLHRSFANATHNAVLMATMELLHDSRNDPVWGALKKNSFTHESRDTYRREHRAIVTSLIERDREKACISMSRHLSSIKKYLRA